jgi:hypothetical protein
MLKERQREHKLNKCPQGAVSETFLKAGKPIQWISIGLQILNSAVLLYVPA